MQIQSKHFFWLSLPLVSLLVSPALTSGQTGGAQPLITQPVNEHQLTVLKGNTYPLARPRYDRGPAPASLPMDRMMLVLKRSPQQKAALGALLNEQQEKSSPSYHKWLTPARFGQRFGLSSQDIQTIVAWLQSHGFRVGGVANGRGVIEFSGSAGAVEQAFHTSIHKYVVKGKAHWANATNPEIPTALTPAVAGISSLNNFPRKPMHRVAGIFRKSKTTGQAIPVQQPAYTFACGSGVNCYALGPYDFATIYNVLPLWNAGIDGTGQTIAIVGESDINTQDVDDFRNMFGLPSAKLNVIHNGPAPGPVNGDETESDLDVEWAGAVAKGATIDFVVSQSTEATQGVDLSAEYIVDHDLAPVMSESYGACELDLGTAGNQFYNQLWQQASAEGITVVVSTGDGGSAVCDTGYQGATNGLAVNGLASTPYNVAVGGTDFNDALDASTHWSSTNNSTTQASALSYIPEAAWNDTCTNPELAQLTGLSSDAETNCNNYSLTSQYPFLLLVYGGSGGASNCISPTSQSPSGCGGGYPKPAWQTGTGVPSDSARDVPDVSLFAGDGFNGNFYIVCEADQQSGSSCSLSSGTFLGVGGTSAATPAFAAILAMVNQKTKSPQGNANYVLYPLAAKTGASCASVATPAGSCIFYDETSGTNAMPCLVGSPDCTINTVGDNYGVLTGYANTTGYDPANGLGSVNAANMVNNWGSVSFKSTTTTLQLNGGNAVNVAHGTAVSVNIAVSPASPAPTGSVSLIAEDGGTNFDAGTFTLSNGVATGTTTLLPGGTSYNVIARYAGDGTYGASDSSPVAVTVNSEASKTFANLVTFDAAGNVTSLSASNIVYGTINYLFRVDVGDSSATYSSTTGISSTCSNQTASCPTGTVSVTNNGASFAGGNLPLNNQGYAEDQQLAQVGANALPAGTYSVTASYPGDSSYGPSTGAANFTIAKAPTTETVYANATYGSKGYITAQVNTTSYGSAPTGTASFTLDGSPFTPSNLTYSPYASTPSNLIAAYDSISGDTPPVLAMGSHTLTMNYPGDTNYVGGTATMTYSVWQASPSFTSLTASPSQTNINQQVTLTALLDGSKYGAAPTGTITFHDGDTPLSGKVTYTSTSASNGNDSSLQATTTYTPTTGGNHSISAWYSGDTNYLSVVSASMVLSVDGPDFSVGPGSSGATITIDSPGSSGTATVQVTAKNGFTGTVSFSTTCPSSSFEMTCSLSPASVDLTSSTPSASTKLTINTTAPSLLPPSGEPAGPGWPGNGLEVALVCIFGLAMMLFWVRRRRPERRWRSAFAVLALASALALASCGGGGQSSPPPPTDPGTPVGSYGVTVTAKSGSLSHSTDISINVQ
jgi:hypothetical protein